MRKNCALVVAIAIAALACTSVDLGACGDKFLRVGRSARLKGYASIHPATILVYQPPNATDKRLKEFETLLKQAGHKPVFVPNGARLAAVVAGGKYDLVIADYGDAATIKEQLRSLPARPDVLPILDKPSKALLAQAEKEYHCLIKPQSMTKYDALEEIDHALDMRLRDVASPSAVK
jgi:hypothetical protein